MSKPANTTLIGIFVLTGMLLAIGTFVMVSSLKLFSKELTCVLYFDESVNNLNIGSPVKFKGVPVGKVKDIRIRWNQSEQVDAIPVFVTIDLKRMNERLGVSLDVTTTKIFEKEINDGLRGRLQMESFVTGLLFVDLNYIESPGRANLRQVETIYPEIPTLPSELAKYGDSITDILGKIGALDIKAINDNLNTLLRTATEEIKGANLPGLSRSLTSTSNSIRDLTTSKKVDETLDALRASLKQLQSLTAQLEKRTNSVADKAEEALSGIHNTLGNINHAAAELQLVLSPESTTRYQLDNALAELTRAAQAATQLLDYIERNPKAFLSGRPPAPESTAPSSE
ncbi:MAG: MlaD family protein [Verrucomicrobiota bacterium]|nr:MlaD family protein [Verrucomicrobiota bacterium]